LEYAAMQLENKFRARGPERGRYKILCIDDEPQVLEGLKLLLGRRYVVETARDGMEGLKALEQYEFPVVICDMRMPGISGAEFMERAAARWPTTVAILLSGARAFGHSQATRGVERAFRLLTKPCDPHILRATVAEGVSHHETLVRHLSAPGV
jgi:YesN/AraC family two-component response regulator